MGLRKMAMVCTRQLRARRTFAGTASIPKRATKGRDRPTPSLWKARHAQRAFERVVSRRSLPSVCFVWRCFDGKSLVFFFNETPYCILFLYTTFYIYFHIFMSGSRPLLF